MSRKAALLSALIAFFLAMNASCSRKTRAEENMQEKYGKETEYFMGLRSLQMGEEAKMFMRVGKRFIVNLDYIYSVNMAKQCLILSDMEHFAYQLPISKEALRQMKELMIKVKM